MATSSSEMFPPDVEAQFNSTEADYNFDRTVTEVELPSSSGEESDDDLSQDDSVDKATELEKRKLEEFVKNSCGCKLGPNNTACSIQFSKEQISDHRDQCATLDRCELDMLVLGQLEAQTKQGDAQRKFLQFFFQSHRICRVFFMFLNHLSQKKYRNLLEHYYSNGVASREHGNTHKQPHNRLAYDEVVLIKRFIEKYAEDHALPLPGRMPNHKDKALLLPSNCSKSEVYRQYVHACNASGKKAVSWGKFHSLWAELLPHISTMKPATDLCLACQNNATIIQQSANLSEDDKSEKLKAAELHLAAAKSQREHYNQQVKAAKDTWDKYRQGGATQYKETMHYSFDYAQNISYPSNPQQPGPAYFKSTRKCGLFGVCCEPLSIQVNYLIDEDDDPGKGANATISMLHHFLDNHGVGETHLKLHADNCVGQNKNNYLMQYLMWRVRRGLNKSIEISFMLVGHTKFGPDRFFGVLKKSYRHTFVSTLDELADVVKKSMIAGNNIPQLTTTSSNRIVTWYDWKSHFTGVFKVIPGITKYHHFRFDFEDSQHVFVRLYASSDEQKVKILATEEMSCRDLPAEVAPKRMDLARRWYLFSEISQFCSSPATASITCPRPNEPNSSSDVTSSTVQSKDSTTTHPTGLASAEASEPIQAGDHTRKRKRTCSHCHEEGHTKTKRGKISCPKLLE